MSSEIENVKGRVLASKPLFIAHPGGNKLSEFYPNPSNCTSHVAESLNQHGSYRISFNQARFGASQTAIISTSSLLNNFAILITMDPANAANTCPEPGWGFDVIETVQFSFSNSLMQDVSIPGPLLREYSLYLCKDDKERNLLLETAGRAFNGVDAGGTGIKTAVVPMNFLSFIGTNHSFPLDLSVLSSGTVQIRVTTRAANQVLLSDAAAALTGAPALASMTIITSTSTLLQSAFSVRNAMLDAPDMIYSLPSKYLNFYQYSIAAGVNPITTEQTIQLSSVPSGQLEAMFIVVRENRAAANPEQTPAVNNGALIFETLRLTYGSQTIYDSRSYEERCYYLKAVFDDDMSIQSNGYESALTAGNVKRVVSLRHYQVAVLPFVHRGAKVKSGAFMENVPNYGGSQLSLSFTIKAPEKLSFKDGVAASINATYVVGGAAAAGYSIWVGYLMSSILMISNGTIDLQL